MKSQYRLLLAWLVLVPWVDACADDSEEHTRKTEARNMSGPTVSRPSAPVVAPVEYQGVRYVQDEHDDRAGDQPGGYLAAYDLKSGERLWRLKVYEVADLRSEGKPTLARYFRSMRMLPDGSALEIVNEAGGVYRIDLATKTSVQVSGPPATTGGAAPGAAPSKPKPAPR